MLHKERKGGSNLNNNDGKKERKKERKKEKKKYIWIINKMQEVEKNTRKERNLNNDEEKERKENSIWLIMKTRKKNFKYW